MVRQNPGPSKSTLAIWSAKIQSFKFSHPNIIVIMYDIRLVSSSSMSSTVCRALECLQSNRTKLN